MCLSKAEPNYYRCDWKNDTAKQLADRLVKEAITLQATVVVDFFTSDEANLSNSILDQLEKQLAEAIGTLSTEDLDEVRKSLPQPGKRKLGKGHLVCAISATIGDACHAVTSVPASIAKTAGEAVAENTGSQLLGEVSELVVQRWIAAVTATSPLAQLKQIGFIADTIAVCTCPGQQEDGEPSTHPEVVDCEGRIRSSAVQAEVKAVFNTDR